jgi:hypothetical protein
LLFCFFLLATSGDALVGWAASLHNVYTVVGGYFDSISVVSCLFAHASHVFVFFLDRFHEGLKNMDYWKLLHVQLEHQSLVSLHPYFFLLFEGLKNMDYWKLLHVQLEHQNLVSLHPYFLQGHHMALAMEERTTTELLGCNDAIAALKHEVELLKGEKVKLSADVV